MDNFGSSSTHESTEGHSRSIGSSISHGKSLADNNGTSESVGYYSGYTGTPSHHMCMSSDPQEIARFNFQDQVRDALSIMKNCGALRLAEEREWCIAEVQRLLLELFTDDVA